MNEHEIELLLELCSKTTVEELNDALGNALCSLTGATSFRYIAETMHSEVQEEDETATGLLIFPVTDDRILLLEGVQDSLSPFVSSTLLKGYRYLYFGLQRALTDMLTGLLNRGALDDHLLRYIQVSHERRQKNPSRCLAMLDIDYFKIINDSHGHLYGDEILVRIGQLMRAAFRIEDHLFRYGGEEFAVILEDIELFEAQRSLNRFLKQVSEESMPVGVGTVTLSAGVTQIYPPELPGEILSRADRALYWVKANGRNKLGVYERLVEEGLLDTAMDNSEKGQITWFDDSPPT